jgi:hypothetical protein
MLLCGSFFAPSPRCPHLRGTLLLNGILALGPLIITRRHVRHDVSGKLRASLESCLSPTPSLFAAKFAPLPRRGCALQRVPSRIESC